MRPFWGGGGEKKIKKPIRTREGPTFLVPCLGVQHVFQTSFPQYYLDSPPPRNMGAVSDEHGKMFHQDIFRIKKLQRQMEPKYVG